MALARCRARYQAATLAALGDVGHARALADAGHVAEGCALAADALTIGRRYGSERITGRVREFRASLPHYTSDAADLDDELTALYAADGADTLFARAVLDAGGELVVIVPAEQYRDGLPAEHHPTYDALFNHAADVIRLDHTASTSNAHMAASVRMIDEADELLAVWDGQPARGYGGTADVVNAARERALPVTVIWPNGATRD
ncbi:hypothetical protein [Haloechinothrix halophila]|uniref:hypothetical protein n=1 Tax=Haloechinothrix halophila TaxID=1069073 RepID=UPI0004197628|nr:hypothetical protein [Haloechinothrix halophila]